MTAKTKRISLKLSESELKTMKTKASQSGLTLSAWIRQQLIYKDRAEHDLQVIGK